MILVTGGAGFIGSALIWALNERGITNILVADSLGTEDKWLNLRKRQIHHFVHKDGLWDYLAAHPNEVRTVFHLGACSATTEADGDYLIANNHDYSRRLFLYCMSRDIGFYYASSAATYGLGEHGYSDEQSGISRQQPLNKYGYSKQLFDHWVMSQKLFPPHWAGFKFFNVYGPQEYHKGSQASVLYHAFPQIRDTGSLKLFKSYRAGVEDGGQRRDFVYVKDVVKVMLHFYDEGMRIESGIYNLGSGKARSFRELGAAAFSAMNIPSAFNWIEMPANIRGQYQYFTEADLGRLRQAGGYKDSFYSLEDGVHDYYSRYLLTADPYL